MIDYREIIRLKNLNHSNAHVAVSVGSSRNTVADVYHRSKNLISPLRLLSIGFSHMVLWLLY